MNEPDQGRLARLAPGTVVAERYRVVRRIGQGGISIVYEVEHLALAKRFALKVIRWRKSHHADLVERLKREALAISRIKHPNIVSITDFGTTTDGLIYYVMELLGGITLAWTIAQRGAYSMSGALSVLTQAAHALVAAHQARIVHRDLKPENIIIEGKEDTQGARRELVKILDFGLATSLTHDEGPRLTIQGITVGTVGYASPEQLAGKLVDGRSDIYSFGCVAFEMFTGSRVFSGTPVEVAHAHLESPPPRVRQRAPHARVTDDMEELIDRCLAKDQAQRPHSMADVLAELRRIARVSLTPEGRTWVDRYLPGMGKADPSGDDTLPPLVKRKPPARRDTLVDELLTPSDTGPVFGTVEDRSDAAAAEGTPASRQRSVDSAEMTVVRNPLASTASPVQASTASPVQAPRGPQDAPSAHCLLVESDPVLAGRIEEQIAASGFQVQRADGLAVIDAVREHEPAFVLLSVELLSLSGYAICNRLKKDRDLAHVPVILMTQDASDEIFCLHQTLLTRADAYLSKPFSPKALLATVANVLGAPASAPHGMDEVEVTEHVARRSAVAEVHRKRRRLARLLLLVAGLVAAVAIAILSRR